MVNAKIFKKIGLLFAVLLVLAACASRPSLLPRSAAVPVDVDLTGLWQLRMEPGAKAMPRTGGENGIRIPPVNTQRQAVKRPSRRSSGSAVQVFLETGELLKISQTADGLFISFDRAIVEEYSFGENRIVSVGPIEAQRVSGWQGQTFVVETLDEEGGLLTESWHIDAAQGVLVRDIAIFRGDKQQFASRQRFDRS